MKLTGEEKPIRSRDFLLPSRESEWPKYKYLAKKNSIGYNTFINRVRNLSMLPHKAATAPLQSNNHYVWVGAYLDTRKGHCEALGVDYTTVHGYMTKYNLDFEQAVLRRLKKINEELYYETIRWQDGNVGKET